MRKSLVGTVIVVVLPLLLAAPVRAGEGAERNLLFTVTVVDTGPEGEAARRSSRILALNGTRADLSAGWKVPIPTSTTKKDGVESPVTSFTYQDIGFLAWIDGRITGEGGVHASGRIEVSAVETGGGAAAAKATMPTIASFSQKFDVVLPDGAEVTLAEASRPGGGSMSLRISAEIQR